jgi:hypothetical protein
MEIDFFISHASEDKDAIASPLAEALRDRGYNVWYDKFVLKLGDSLRREIDRGLANSRYGVVIFSPEFFKKQWTQKELDGLVAREIASKGKVILPVWHNVDHDFVSKHSPSLADKLGADTSKGIEFVVDAIVAAIAPPLNPLNSGADEQKDLFYDFDQQNILEWIELQNRLFPGKKASRTEWTDPDEIAEILAEIGAPDRAHCFFPNGGGLDLVGADVSHENQCIELKFDLNSVSVIRPSRLLFFYFRDYPGMSYFRLETSELIPIDRAARRFGYEELTEVSPLDYRDRSVWEEGILDYDKSGRPIRLPSSARIVTRWFCGSFVFFAKGSFYNGLSGSLDAYNGQHNTMTADVFNEFILRIIAEAHRRGIRVDPI